VIFDNGDICDIGTMDKNSLRIKIVHWPNVDSPYKVKKDGLWKGIKGDFFMGLDIVRTVSIFGPFYQIFKMEI
jgi:hypothetical protein